MELDFVLRPYKGINSGHPAVGGLELEKAAGMMPVRRRRVPSTSCAAIIYAPNARRTKRTPLNLAARSEERGSVERNQRGEAWSEGLGGGQSLTY